MEWLVALVVLAAITFAVAMVWGMHRFLLMASRRGWIEYPRGRGRIMEIYDPALDHAIEESISGEVRTIDDASGQSDDTSEDPG